MKESYTNIENRWMGLDLGLTNPYERAVFAHIYSLTARGKGGWKGSVRLLAENMVYPKSSIARALGELIKKGLVVKDGDVYVSVPMRDNIAVNVNVPIRDNSATDKPSVRKPKQPKHNPANDFERFWELYGVPEDYQFEKEECRELWDYKSPSEQLSMINDLAANPVRFWYSAKTYLQRFMP